MAFDSEQQASIERLIEDDRYDLATWKKIRPIRTDRNAISEHLSRILSSLTIEKEMRVVVDCGCGAAALTTPYLLRAMGCEIVTLNSQPDGFFPGRSPEPKEESLKKINF